MQRAPIVIASTAAGLALVLGYDPRVVPTAAAPAATTTKSPTTTTSPTTTSPTTSRAATSRAATRSATGPLEQISEGGRPYGAIQVRATVRNGTLSGVSIVQLTPYDGRSQGIDAYAVPELVQESLSAKSAHVDAVSGATYTSAAYMASLQAALDKLA